MIWTLLGFVVLLLLVALFFPWPEKPVIFLDEEAAQTDERNIMFSRAELVPGSERYASYYREFPEHRVVDDQWRKAAGLLGRHAALYHPVLFPAADATFFAVGGLHSQTDGPVSREKSDLSMTPLESFLRNWAREMGCHSLGIALLKRQHLYSTGGRNHNYNQPVQNTHSHAIAFTVEMDYSRIHAAPKGPVTLESSQQYLRSGAIAVQIAAWLRNLGYEAKAHIDGRYDVKCPQVARDAGLGEIGRMGLLMTPALGPRVRIGVVTTNAPFSVSDRNYQPSLIRFCEDCRKCADACPSQAISYDERQRINGALKWSFSQEKCYAYWCVAGTDCGRCIAVCPYAHKANALHNFVRFFIRTSPLFRKLAIRMDDWFYGRKPPPGKLPGWMNLKN